MRRLLLCALLIGEAPALADPFRPYLTGSSVAVDPQSGDVMVAESDAGALVVVSPGVRRLLRTIPVGGAPEQVVIGPDGTAYVTLRAAGEVVAVAAGADRAGARASVGVEPIG